MLKCNFVFCGMCLSTFSHDVVQILASPESIAGGAPNCKTGELTLYSFLIYNNPFPFFVSRVYLFIMRFFILFYFFFQFLLQVDLFEITLIHTLLYVIIDIS